MRCVVFGASGYLGARLIPELLAAGHQVRVMVRRPDKLDVMAWRGQVDVVRGDVADLAAVTRALDGQQVLYYLVHSLMRSDFVEFDARAAFTVADAATRSSLCRIVYVGGIVAPGQPLSDHLASRAEVGWLLRSAGVPTVELRAAAIIGAGSASFEMLRYLTERLPIMVTPRWLSTAIQPIAVRDVLYYLTRAASLPADVSRVFDIGGPDRLTYLQMVHRYAAAAGLARRIALPVPTLSPWLSSHWVHLITPLPRPLVVSLMESLYNDVVCTEHDIAEHIADPRGGLMPYDAAVAQALAHIPGAPDGAPAAPLPSDPPWSGGPVRTDDRQRRVHGDPAVAWRTVNDAALRLGGGPARVRHTRSETAQRDDPDTERTLWVRPKLPLPGRLWLQMTVTGGAPGAALYRQRALFAPRGLAGEAMWRLCAPLRRAVLDRIAERIAAAAERRARGWSSTSDPNLMQMRSRQPKPVGG
ncbi:MAG: NAD(P)H-binding protein [Mycobacteriaceae bacterium]|nr:NAD(P)H-binding protein [Mycobacteriaceae bacterium]